MLNQIVKRLLSAIPLLLFVSFFVYSLVDLIPGDAATALAGENATPAAIEETRERLGLNEPLLVRYLDWLGSALRGDLGTSLFSSDSVVNILSNRLPVTLSLTLITMLIVVIVGLPTGVFAAMRANSLIDRALTAASSVAMAVPPFILGLILVILFAILSPVLPATGYTPVGEGLGSWLQHLILPAIAIAAISGAELARQTRAAMVDTLGKDFIRTRAPRAYSQKRLSDNTR